MFRPIRVKLPLRSHRPPRNRQYRATRTHCLSRSSHLFLVSNGAVRPQLGFLPSQSSGQHATALTAPLRFISTETKRYIKEQAIQTGKYTAITTIVIASGLAWLWMLTQELVDRDFPAPKEWTFLSQTAYHSGKGLEVPEANLHGQTDWRAAGYAYRDLLARLEDPQIDGHDLVPQEMAEGKSAMFGRFAPVGFDISAKSYEWRKGYYDALFGCAKAAVEVEDMVLDTLTGLVGYKAYVIGPSNPRPKRMPRQSRISAPLEENCVSVFAAPEDFFPKLLTTTGFTIKEKLEAATTYGAYLNHKGRHDQAEEMYQLAVELAVSGVEKPTQVLDRTTGVLKTSAHVTDNILDATTALAVHRAQIGDADSALPMFLSILRARRAAPVGVDRDLPLSSQPRQTRQTDVDILFGYLSSFKNLLKASEFPRPGLTGNEQFVRSPDTNADEATIMTYIGEILFATSPSQRQAGLSWTKSALELAYNGFGDARTKREAKVRFIDCLSVGLENRHKMLDSFRVDLDARKAYREQQPALIGWIPGLAESERTIAREEEELVREENEAMDFRAMLVRGRVMNKPEAPAPLWNTLFLREWIIPHVKT